MFVYWRHEMHPWIVFKLKLNRQTKMNKKKTFVLKIIFKEKKQYLKHKKKEKEIQKKNSKKIYKKNFLKFFFKYIHNVCVLQRNYT